jgi:hypothetical protein
VTAGERMVWAATYAAVLDRNLRNPPAQITADRQRWQAWEEQQARDAIEHASGAVTRMRDEKERVADGWGPDSDEYRRVCEMIDGVDRG